MSVDPVSPELPSLPASGQAKLRAVQARTATILYCAEAEIEHLSRMLATDAAWQPDGEKEWRRRSAEMRSRAEADATRLVFSTFFEVYAAALDEAVPRWHEALEDYLCAISNEIPSARVSSEGMMQSWFDAELLRACSEFREKVYSRAVVEPDPPVVHARTFREITDAWRKSKGLGVEAAGKQLGIGKSRFEQLRRGRRGDKPVPGPSFDEIQRWAMTLQHDPRELRRAFERGRTDNRTRPVRN